MKQFISGETWSKFVYSIGEIDRELYDLVQKNKFSQESSFHKKNRSILDPLSAECW